MKKYTKKQIFLFHLSSWFIDHEYVRILYRNFHKVDDRLFRSNQPSPKFVKKLKDKYKVKSILNLRGTNKTGHFLLEEKACEEHGVTLINFPISSRRLPTKEQILGLKNIFETAGYPMLLHCKSGADRAGLATCLYQHFILKTSIDKLTGLKWYYGHFKFAETGYLDAFFNSYLLFQEKNPKIDFLTWVKDYYDASKITHFHPNAIFKFVVNKVLRRE